MIQKVSFVFCDTEYVGLDIGKAVEMGIRIMLEKRSSTPPPDRAIGWIFQSCYIDFFKLLHRFVKVVLQ